MTFEEMQSIMQSVIISQRESQAEFDRMRATQQEMQATQQEIQSMQRESQAELQEFKEEVRRIVQSNDRTIQAMLDQTATDRLKREEENAKHEAQMSELRDISRGLVNMLSAMDEDRPTILRKLSTIENKTDTIIERLSRD